MEGTLWIDSIIELYKWLPLILWITIWFYWFNGMESRGKCLVWSDGLISGFKLQTFFHLVVEKLGVLHQILVPSNSGVTCLADCFSTVVHSITAAHHVQGTSKQAVSCTFWAVITGLVTVSALAIDADGCTKSPLAGITVEASKTASFIGVPHIDASGNVAGSPWEA